MELIDKNKIIKEMRQYIEEVESGKCLISHEKIVEMIESAPVYCLTVLGDEENKTYYGYEKCVEIMNEYSKKR